MPASAVDLKKSLQKYRIYRRDIQEQLMRAFVLRTGDERLSERLTA